MYRAKNARNLKVRYPTLMQDRHQHLWMKVANTLTDQVVATLVALLVAGKESLQVETSIMLQKYLKSLGEGEYRWAGAAAGADEYV